METIEEDVDINKIEISGENIRLKVKDAELAELMDSIKQNGLLQAIGLVETPDKKYKILYGHRRYLAIKKLGEKKIAAKIYSGLSPGDILFLNTIENIQRKDINLLDLGRICMLLQKLDMNVGEIAVRLSIPVSRVNTAILAFKRVPTKYRDKVVFMDNIAKQRKTGRVSGAIVNQISNLEKLYSLKKDQVESLYRVATKKDLNSKQISLTGHFLSKGNPLDKSLREMDEWKIVRVDVAVNKKKFDKLKKDNHMKTDYDLCKAIFNSKLIPYINNLAI